MSNFSNFRINVFYSAGFDENKYRLYFANPFNFYFRCIWRIFKKFQHIYMENFVNIQFISKCMIKMHMEKQIFYVVTTNFNLKKCFVQYDIFFCALQLIIKNIILYIHKIIFLQIYIKKKNILKNSKCILNFTKYVVFLIQYNFTRD